MATLEKVRSLVQLDSGLAVVVTQRADGSAQGSVVNAGVVAHPVSGEATVAFVVRAGTIKHRNLRRMPRATLVFRHGWEWIAVEGTVDLAGADDPLPGFGAAAVAGLISDIYTAAIGGSRRDWDEFGRTMVADRNLAVLVRPERVYSNAKRT